ncbi:MAG: nitroreductase [Gemmatimonadetes bacterium]|nr:nitroreductase [Gemmatimonadota bacterium]
MVDTLVAPSIEAIDEFPVSGSPAAKLRAALKFAVLAPSSHNSQPWRFRIARDTLDLHADRSRNLPVVDPRDRELTISCGAALFNLRVALRHFGYEGTYQLLPDLYDADLLAAISLGSAHDPSEEDHALFDAICRRRTYRLPFENRELPQGLVVGLRRAATQEGAWFRPLGSGARSAAAELTAEADQLQMADRRFRQELADWMHPNRTASRDGMPGYALGLGDIMSAAAPLAVRTFDMGDGQAARSKDLIANSPLLAVLGTEGDSVKDWLAAGQALEHVLLRAQMENVSASFLNQAIEVADLRPRLAAIAGRKDYPQILLRMGYGKGVRATPRREVAEILT